MVQIVISVIALATLVLMSLRANRRFARVRRLPMQWSLTGAVNWTAPRAVALGFMPLLAAIVLTAATCGTLLATPRAGQEGMEVPVIALLSLGLVAIHGLHLFLISRTVDGNPG